jgi:hypothetical protein
LLNLHAFRDMPSEYPSLMTSIYYWIFWFVILMIVGYKLSLKKDFLLREV